ncbi:MAG: lytic transglycosylase domain-containing protein [Candidatus Lustribacter sp.]|jgi:soluble lytic murein transglycosylase-like protein
MPLRFAASRIAVTLTIAFAACFASAGQPAGADEIPAAEANYATVLRTINPHLQVGQSLAYARSLLADSERTKLDPNLIMALVTVESSWRATAVSYHGARGLGQLMPTTAHKLGVNPRDPAQNLRGASVYLRSLINRFASRGVNGLRDAIGAYNAGPLAVEQYRGIPPFYETQHYVKKVIAQWHALSVRVAKAFVANAAPAVPADEREWLANADASALPASLAAPVAQP